MFFLHLLVIFVFVLSIDRLVDDFEAPVVSVSNEASRVALQSLGNDSFSTQSAGLNKLQKQSPSPS